jgi:hypothetical protein
MKRGILRGMRKVVSVRQAAQMLGITASGVRLAIAEGRLSGRNLAPPGSLRPTWTVPVAEIERYKREHLGRVGRPRKRARRGRR